MITNKDLEIENISYTNKDFGQIYPELLELIKKMTDKWDPESTNESDPGIVLTKLAAFVCDKLNYNIDKNTLEQFITSATQETSMRRLTDMLGYNMRYYRSATTKVSFRYLGEMGKTDDGETEDKLSLQSQFFIRAFDTTFKTEDDIVYTLLEDLTVNTNQKLSTDKLAIQGELKQLTVLNNEQSNTNLIQLYNLDDQNRLYFPDIQVAENGIFINKDIYDKHMNPDAWRRVDNLNDQELNSKVFKFGFDSSKNLPYIEFPKDIANIIGEGLQVWYILSSGENGKVLNNKLTKFNSIKITNTNGSSAQVISTSLDEDSYVLSNSSSTEAYNPESLTEAYDNFKKVVGTFNTLVSCRDYSNYLNTHIDDDLGKVVSNCVVTDLRTDPSYSKVTFIRDQSGSSYYDNVISATLDPTKYYNLIIHGTTPVNQNIQTLNQYEKTYQKLNSENIIDINTVLEDVKTINHNLVLPDEFNLIEADYTLKANISTKYKVNTTEQKQIVDNIKKSLYNNFNANKVDFGEEIPYDTLVNVIKNADTRIKNVNLDDPDIEYYVCNSTTTQGAYTKTEFNPNTYIDIIVDNVRAGALPLYGEDTSFSYDYDMDLNGGVQTINNLAAIDASVTIDTPEYTLKSNESVQLIEDSYITQITYPAYIYYAFITDQKQPGEVAIPKNTIYKLKDNETLCIHYTDSSDKKQYLRYRAGTVIQANFDICNTSGIAQISGNVENTAASKFINFNTKEQIDLTYSSYNASQNPNVTPLYSIGTNEQIDILKRHEVTIPNGSKCFWYIKPRVVAGSVPSVSNEVGDIKFTKNPYNDSYYYILEEGEFFIYPNDDMTSLNILTSGTKIESPVSKSLSRVIDDVINIEDLQNSLEDEDIGTFTKSFKWQTIDRKLTIVESSISTFIEGDVLNTVKDGESDLPITKDWNKLSQLKVNDDIITLSPQTCPVIRSVLSISCSSDQPQKILSGQSVKIYSSNIHEESTDEQATLSTTELRAGDYIQLSPAIDSYNDLIVLQDLLYYEADDGTYRPYVTANNKYLHTFKNYNLIKYRLKGVPSTVESISDLILKIGKDNISINSRDEYIISYEKFKEAVGNKTSLNIKCNIENMYFNIFDTASGKTRLLSSNGSSSTIVVDLSEFNSGTLYITKPKVLLVYNYLSSSLSKKIIDKLKLEPKFDWIGPKNKSKIIDSYDPLYSFFNVNNIYNKFTLPKIDFNRSEFKIVGSSKL